MKQGFSICVSGSVTVSCEVWAYSATFAFVDCCFKWWPGSKKKKDPPHSGPWDALKVSGQDFQSGALALLLCS
jgi:hypothetical protein